MKLLQTLELLEHECLHSSYQRRMAHNSLTAWVELYNLFIHSVIARNQIVTFFFQWKRSFRLLDLHDGNVVGNAACCSRQPRAAHAFWIKKWELKPISQNYGIAKSHTGLLWSERRRRRHYMIFLIGDLIRNEPQHHDSYGSIFM